MFQMWILTGIIFGFYLLFLAVIDCRNRKLPLWMLLLIIILALLSGIVIEGAEYFCDRDLWIGVICGIFFLGVSWVTHEKLGFADSIIILGIFLLTGYEKGIVCVTTAFFLAGAAALFLLFTGRAGKHTAMPFIPYLFAGYVMGVILSI